MVVGLVIEPLGGKDSEQKVGGLSFLNVGWV